MSTPWSYQPSFSLPSFDRVIPPILPPAAVDLGRGKRGGDLYTVVGLDLREASTGVETLVSVSALGPCTACKVRQLWGRIVWGAG